MAARNLTIQLDEDLIHAAKVLAAEAGMSLSALVAHDLREKIAARRRQAQAMQAAVQSMTEAGTSGRVMPRWNRAELYDR